MTRPALALDLRNLQPGRLWSLADVINSRVAALCALCAQLKLEQMLREQWGDEPVENDDLVAVNRWLDIASEIAEDFELQAVTDRISIIRRQIAFGITQAQLSVESRVLGETLGYGFKGHLIYRYPSRMSKTLKNWRQDWAPAIEAFPSAQADIWASVDLWALQHSTASVFHLMRVLEHGLHALASDLGLTFDIQNWQNILDQIEAKIRDQSRLLPRGAAKSDRLRFLSEAAKEFHFFKDGWRNYVSHNRSIYDEHQARSVMDHVRSFMNGLSSQLAEQPAP